MLLYFPEAEATDAPPDSAEADAIRRAYKAYKEGLVADGVFLAGEALQPADIATTVRADAGDAVVTDGPFIEMTEQLAGFYLCECRDLDHAIEVAAGIPGTRHGANVEIRPVFDYESLLEG